MVQSAKKYNHICTLAECGLSTKRTQLKGAYRKQPQLVTQSTQSHPPENWEEMTNCKRNKTHTNISNIRISKRRRIWKQWLILFSFGLKNEISTQVLLHFTSINSIPPSYMALWVRNPDVSSVIRCEIHQSPFRKIQLLDKLHHSAYKKKNVKSGLTCELFAEFKCMTKKPDNATVTSSCSHTTSFFLCHLMRGRYMTG